MNWIHTQRSDYKMFIEGEKATLRPARQPTVSADGENSSRPPAERRMPPVQIRLRLIIQTRQLSLGVLLVSLRVVPLHVEQHEDTQDENHRARTKVQTIANRIIRPVERQESPSRNQTTDVAEHDVCADGGSARRVRQDVGGHLRVAQGSEGEGAGGDEEGGAVTGLGILRGEEHDVSDHDEGGGDDEEDLASVEAPGEEGEEDREEGADDVGWDGAELLIDDCVGVGGVDRLG